MTVKTKLDFDPGVSSFRPLVVFEDGVLAVGSSLENAFFIFTLLAVMYYFFFSYRHENRAAKGDGPFRPLAPDGVLRRLLRLHGHQGPHRAAGGTGVQPRTRYLLVDWYGKKHSGDSVHRMIGSTERRTHQRSAPGA